MSAECNAASALRVMGGARVDRVERGCGDGGSRRRAFLHAAALVVAVVLAPTGAAAQGADVDLFAGVGGAVLSSTAGGDAGSGGETRALVELGGAVGTPLPGLSVAGAATLGLGAARFEPGAWLGVRSVFGRDAFATWVDFDVAARFGPRFDLGPRFAFGARWEFLPALAAYGSLSGQLGLLGGLRGDLGLSIGIMGLFTLGG